MNPCSSVAYNSTFLNAIWFHFLLSHNIKAVIRLSDDRKTSTFIMPRMGIIKEAVTNDPIDEPARSIP